MINLQVTGRHFELDDKVVKYVNDKIGVLDKFATKKRDQEASGQVVLQLDASQREDNDCVCDVTLNFHGQKFHARESTLNMYAAIDICEAKLKSQLLKYKDKRAPGRNRRRMLFGKMFGRDPLTNPDLTEE